MDTSTSDSGREPLPFGRLPRAALLLTLALAGAASAAPCARDDCRNATGDLQGSPLPLGDLTVRIVDLGETDAVEDPAAGLSESMAPLLYLTPRVTSILEEVFADSGVELAAGPAREEPGPASPVADTDHAEDPARYGPLSQADSAAHLPKFQRQMYRTDI